LQIIITKRAESKKKDKNNLDDARRILGDDVWVAVENEMKMDLESIN